MVTGLSLLEQAKLNKAFMLAGGGLSEDLKCDNLFYEVITRQIDELDCPVLPVVEETSFLSPVFEYNIGDEIVVPYTPDVSTAIYKFEYDRCFECCKERVFVCNMRRYFVNKYFLDSALCVYVDKDRNTHIVTNCSAITDTFVLASGKTVNTENITAQDIENGEIRCVKIKETPKQLRILPFAVNANSEDVLIIPKAWYDRFIDKVNLLLNNNVCRVVYTKRNKDIECLATTQTQQYCLCNDVPLDQLLTQNQYGVIAFYNISKSKVEKIPATSILAIRPICDT